MGALTATTPKPMLYACGAPLAFHSLFFLQQRGVRRAIFNLHYLGRKIEQGVASVRALDISFSSESSILGTAGGIRNAIHLIADEYVLVLNPDSILWPERSYALDDLLSLLGDGEALLFLADRRTGETGLRLAPSGEVQFDAEGPEYYVGCSLMKKSLFSRLHPGERAELGPLWKELAERRLLRGVRFAGEILDLGTAESYMRNRDAVIPAHLQSAWMTFLEECQ